MDFKKTIELVKSMDIDGIVLESYASGTFPINNKDFINFCE